MKIYTITTLLRTETECEAETFVAKSLEDAQNIAKTERAKFKNDCFNEGDNDYEEYNCEDYYSAWSNICFEEFSATIKEHEI